MFGTAIRVVTSCVITLYVSCEIALYVDYISSISFLLLTKIDRFWLYNRLPSLLIS
jgi:hypothetical protein